MDVSWQHDRQHWHGDMSNVGGKGLAYLCENRAKIAKRGCWFTVSNAYVNSPTAITLKGSSVPHEHLQLQRHGLSRQGLIGGSASIVASRAAAVCMYRPPRSSCSAACQRVARGPSNCCNSSTVRGPPDGFAGPASPATAPAAAFQRRPPHR